ncbi:MAG: hypothetical protein WCJ39_10820 [bacterium]
MKKHIACSINIDYKKFEDESITLDAEKMELLKSTIVENLDLTEKFNERRTSYGLKHLFENVLGFYLSNMDFKEAMKQLEIPNNGDMVKRNVSYPVSESTCNFLRDTKGSTFYTNTKKESE